MTYYDQLMDVIKERLYEYYTYGLHEDSWHEEDAQESARMILEIVEEFQQKRSSTMRWRASD